MMKALPNDTESALAVAIRLCGGEGFETALFDFLGRATGADNLVILAFRKGHAPLSLYHRAADDRVFAAVETTYLGGAYLLDPVYDLHLSHAPQGVYRLADIAPDAFHRSRYFEEYYRQTTITDEVAFLAYPRPEVSLTLCLGRDATSGSAFSAGAIGTCRRIAGIVIALAERHWSTLPDDRVEEPDLSAAIQGALETQRGIRLSARQAEVALLILRGHSTASIAHRLGLSPLTVKVFRRQIHQRCGISSQAELFALMLPLLKPKA
jgi:DNA-binding CsgD family transcriptional regulator